MDKVQLVKLINDVVEYKMKKLIPQLEEKIRNQISEEMHAQKPGVRDTDLKSILESGSDEEQEEVLQESKKPKREEIYFTKDPILNRVMNESITSPRTTYGSSLSPDTEEESEMETMNFTTQNMIVPGQRLAPRSAKPEPVVLKREIEAMTGGNTELANIMVKDYRSTLKQWDDQVKRTRGA
jgi:hypothetical protein